MKVPFAKSDKYGSYQLEQQGSFLLAIFQGVIGLGLSKAYLRDLKELAGTMPTPWIYIADCLRYQAAIPDAALILQQAYEECLKLGCMGDAYCIDSAVGIAQLAEIRKRSNICSPIEDKIFADMESAKQAMHKYLQALPHC
ncbi:hypothetical protein [Bowmanella dokdonensis]|uniref:Uncharacterized protein n=1 Tax=Bowmanella dokdonensis TaxID=751969 RepID=A0A939DKU5_9ALTE|nr:hypothetical protein [Bowmanella dokdonensis]MBN7824020.1 hypothetical protein [Bowmanella dokdonensis]